jgi:Ca2+-binding EF-hand superfamily protein
MVSVHFDHYDHDNNGLLDMEEMKELVNDSIRRGNPRRRVTSVEMNIVLNNYDLDNDGMVSRSELLSAVLKQHRRMF